MKQVPIYHQSVRTKGNFGHFQSLQHDFYDCVCITPWINSSVINHLYTVSTKKEASIYFFTIILANSKLHL